MHISDESNQYFEKLKTNVTNKKMFLHVDFAENFSMREQDEIQTRKKSEHRIRVFLADIRS